MSKFPKRIRAFVCLAAAFGLVSFFTIPASAHVIHRHETVVVERPLEVADTPIGEVFHLAGDIVSFPFYVICNLF